MKTLKVLTIFLFLLIVGFILIMNKNFEQSESEKPTYSSSGKMIIGNILVADLWNSMYKKDTLNKHYSTKSRKDVSTDLVEIDLQTVNNQVNTDLH